MEKNTKTKVILFYFSQFLVPISTFLILFNCFILICVEQLPLKKKIKTGRQFLRMKPVNRLFYNKLHYSVNRSQNFAFGYRISE